MMMMTMTMITFKMGKFHKMFKRNKEAKKLEL